jgi:hypothetical protein
MATATATRLNLKFKFQNETKGAVRYGEVLEGGKIAIAPHDPGSCIGVLYVRKSAFGSSTFPSELSVTVEG